MIENTSRRDAFVNLVGAMADGTDKYITDMEAAGQRQLVNGSELPYEGPWNELEALGFTRGEPVEGDGLFIHATLPEGWRKEPTDHSMWSKVVDERGIERVSIFYKAAFYDRRAFCRIDQIGPRVVRDALYGDGPVELPDFWDTLTASEKAECAAAVTSELAHEHEKRKYFADNPEGMKISDEHIARLEAFAALLAPGAVGGAA